MRRYETVVIVLNLMSGDEESLLISSRSNRRDTMY